MEGAYLPGNIRQRMQELMKEHKITQAQLATRIGSTESAISRFVSGKTDKISTEHLLRIAKVFEVSTDFLLGEVNTPDRTNFDIEELGLSVQAARNLYTGKANAEIVNRLLESPRFAEVTYMIEQYFDDTLAAGFAGQNQMLTTLSAMLRRNNKTDAAVQAARTVNRQKVPCISGRPDDDTEHIYGGAAGSEERDRQRFHSGAVFDQGHHPADVLRVDKRPGCPGTDHHARNDFRRRHPERGRDGRCAKGSIRQVWSGADGISPIHLRPRAGEAKCRPGAMSSCAAGAGRGYGCP